MDSSSFYNLVESVKNTGIARNQVELIDTTIQAVGYISASQVAQLIKLIPFEKNRLEVAMAAYPYAIDRGSFPTVVASALTFRRTKVELMEFIRNQ